jgi:hypothetical protein
MVLCELIPQVVDLCILPSSRIILLFDTVWSIYANSIIKYLSIYLEEFGSQ